MHALVMYESMFGNTQKVAEAVGAGLRHRGGAVTVAPVGSASRSVLAGVDFLVVGAPTHALALSSQKSRAEAVARGADPQMAASGIREWLVALALDSPPVPRVVAVFDTRISKVRHWPGSAGKQVSRKLSRSGLNVIDRATFYVRDVPGPLVDGELARAEAWGDALGDLLLTTPDGLDHAER